MTLDQWFSTFSDSRTTFEMLSRFADHQCCDEKEFHFPGQKFPMTFLLISFPKIFEFPK